MSRKELIVIFNFNVIIVQPKRDTWVVSLIATTQVSRFESLTIEMLIASYWTLTVKFMPG